MRSAYYVIKLLNPRDGATVGYWRRDRWTPRLKNHLATRFSTAEEARGVGSGWMPDHEFGRFMAGWPPCHHLKESEAKHEPRH